MEANTNYRFLSLSPYKTPNLKSNRKPKGIKVTRRELEVADLEEDAENLGGTICINRTSNVVRMPNGEVWNYGGQMWKGRLNGVSHHFVWKDTSSEPTEYPAKCAPWIDELSQRALEQIDYPWQSLGTSIKFVSCHKGRQRKWLGTALPANNQIEIYLTIRDEPVDVAHTVAHEIGHIVDWICLTDEDRRHWRSVRGFSRDYPWYGSELRTDWKDPCGDFAECFAGWQVSGASVCVSQPITDVILDLVAELSSKQH